MKFHDKELRQVTLSEIRWDDTIFVHHNGELHIVFTISIEQLVDQDGDFYEAAITVETTMPEKLEDYEDCECFMKFHTTEDSLYQEPLTQSIQL